MEHSRKQKLLIIIALVVGFACLSIGFAAFSTTLNISSSASVTPGSDAFSVKFSTNKDSLVVNSVVPSGNVYNVDVTNGVINNLTNPTITNLSATFTEPGQVVVYTFYARNEGEYTAYLNSVNFIGDKVCTPLSGASSFLVNAACDDIGVSVVLGRNLYDETTPVTGHALLNGVGEEIQIVLQYVGSGERADGPFSIKFPDIALVYSSIDDSSIPPSINKVVNLESGDLNTIGSIVSIGNEKFYVFGQEDGIVKLLAMYNLHVGNLVDVGNKVTPITNPTGIQDSTAIGYNENNYPYVGTTVFAKSSSSYIGSDVEKYVENYGMYLSGLGANIEEVRLISKEELEKLGCSSAAVSCFNAPKWVYSSSYWAGTALNDKYIWRVHVDSIMNYNEYYVNSSNGVRPVVEIPLSEF